MANFEAVQVYHRKRECNRIANELAQLSGWLIVRFGVIMPHHILSTYYSETIILLLYINNVVFSKKNINNIIY